MSVCLSVIQGFNAVFILVVKLGPPLHPLVDV